jgi:hypothetical protein
MKKITPDMPEWKRKDRELDNKSRTCYLPKTIGEFPQGKIVQDADGKTFAITNRGVRRNLGF